MPFSRGFLQGAQYEDSDSSRGEDLPGELGSGNSSNSSTANDRTVADLTRTCSNLQTQVLLEEILNYKSLLVQVEQLQSNLASVIHFVSERSRHSSSSQDTPPLRSVPMMATR